MTCKHASTPLRLRDWLLRISRTLTRFCVSFCTEPLLWISAVLRWLPSFPELLHEALRARSQSAPGTGFSTVGDTAVDEGTVRSLVASVMRIVDADGVALLDFASVARGAHPIASASSNTFVGSLSLSGSAPHSDEGGYSVWSRFVAVAREPAWSAPGSSRSSSVALQRGAYSISDLWLTVGQSGYLSVELSEAIIPNAFTLEYLPHEVITSVERMAALRSFRLYGAISAANVLESLQCIVDNSECTSASSPILIGQGVFDYTVDNAEELPPHRQTFHIPSHIHDKVQMRGVRVVLLVVDDNYGHPTATGLARLRVHGEVLHVDTTHT